MLDRLRSVPLVVVMLGAGALAMVEDDIGHAAAAIVANIADQYVVPVDVAGVRNRTAALVVVELEALEGNHRMLLCGCCMVGSM